MTAKNNRKIKVLAPLSDFNWEGNRFQIHDLGLIKRLDETPDLSWCEDGLSAADKDELRYVSHWLAFEQSKQEKLSPSEKINILLLALWIVRPTRVQVRFRFELQQSSGHGRLSRYYDQFQWINTQVKDRLETHHLQKLQAVVDSLKAIYITHKRLWNSFILTFNGCTTIHWQVAFICFGAAAEGILTYENGPGVTKRLAKSFACLTKKTKVQRDSAYRAFKHSYSVRSDIMHGRIAYSTTRGEAKLRELVKFSNLLRKLWKIILSSQSWINELEKNDAERKVWFAKIEHGYQPPKT